MTNAVRFINAYNVIDNSLRSIYNYGTGVSFTELIRRVSSKNYIVGANENLLIDYGRLRNAIIHKSVKETIIAEPHTSVVEKIEHLAELISRPPKAISVFNNRKVVTISADALLIDAIKLINKTNFSNIPVYKGYVLMGIINNKLIVKSLGAEAEKGGNIDKFLNSRTVASILDESYFKLYYDINHKDVTVDAVAQSFYSNKKLLAMLITENGSRTEKPITIITAYDIMEIENILNSY
jgi:predicted transcriptional regulator